MSADRNRKGFTLVELAVVIVIIGVLAAFGVPKFLKSVERSKAAEAFQYLAAVRSAQERYIAQNGVYSTDLTQLDITQQTPKYFTLGTLSTTGDSGGNPIWTMTLLRIAATSSYGAYTVTFTQDGFDATNSTIASNPTLNADINPLGSTSS
jgi:prepilin-type N-terminal cleavage/methylation domain-containing protein